MTKNTIPNIWTAQERLLHIYKLLTSAISIIALVLVSVVIAQGYQNPIVVLKSGEIQEFYPTERKIAPIGKNEVEEFTKKFLVSLYVWNEFNAQKLAKEISMHLSLLFQLITKNLSKNNFCHLNIKAHNNSVGGFFVLTKLNKLSRLLKPQLWHQ